MVKLLKKKKTEKKVEKKIEKVEKVEKKELSASAKIAQKLNDLMRSNQFDLYLITIQMALKKEVKRMYWNLPSWDAIKEAVAKYLLGIDDQFLFTNYIQNEGINY